MTDKVTLQLAIQALDAGDLSRAQHLLAEVLKANPRDVRAWVLMAEAQTDPRRRKECIDRALALDPHNEIARLLLEPEPVDANAWAHKTPATASEESLHVEWGGTDALSHPEESPRPKPPTAPIPAPAAPRPRTPEEEQFIKNARQSKPSLETAMSVYDIGERVVAIEILRKVVQRQPHDEMAWVGLIEMIEDHAERARTAQEALKHHPRSAMVQKAAGRATGTIAQLPEETPAAPAPQPRR